MHLRDYVKELSRVKFLEREEEAELWRKFREEQDDDARRLLIESYQPLVFKQAMPFRKRENIMDIIQEGTVGLLEAVETYDVGKGVAFSLYAIHRIRGRMLDFIKKEGRMDVACMDGEEGWGLRKECFADVGVTVAEQAENHELAERLHQAMERLPKKERAVLEGVYFHSDPVKEVAQHLNVSPSHIYRLQQSGIRRVRGMLSRFMQYW